MAAVVRVGVAGCREEQIQNVIIEVKKSQGGDEEEYKVVKKIYQENL